MNDKPRYMSNFEKSKRNTVKRVPKRGHYDRTTIYEVLDAALIAHVGFVVDAQPFVIPTLFGRDGDNIYLHGATKSRMIQSLEQGVPVCITVTHVDGLVLARSLFHHSANYRSAVIFGTAKLVPEKEKEAALKVISDHLIPGRWDEARLPNALELKATSILKLTIESASAKIRTGGPKDEPEDYDLPVWAGVVPFIRQLGDAIVDEDAKADLPVPESVLKMMQSV
ncbi:MAG: flavin-nucleotide-binding protein [Saprospiraceae bacterium]|nr:MAG: flavin-nucleotide-binding protein [Saprospiraceae bacterium]